MRNGIEPAPCLPGCSVAASNIILLSATDFCLDFVSVLLIGTIGDLVPKVCARRVRAGSKLEVAKRTGEKRLSIELLSRVIVDP